MSSREDIIEIPIEIQTGDLDEIRALIQELENIKGTTESAKMGRYRTTSGAPIQRGDTSNNKRKMPSSGRAPIQRNDQETSGIFRPSDNEEVLPLKSRDVTSKQATQRTKSFDMLKKDVESLKQTNNDVYPLLGQIGSLLGFSIPPVIMSGKQLIQGIKSKIPQQNKAAIPTPSIPNFGGKLGKLAVGMGKALPFIGIAVVLIDWLVTELPAMINEQMYGVGKHLDRRFKRVIQNEYVASATMEEKAQIAQGYRTIITTSYSGARGASMVANSKERALRQGNIYNQSQEYLIK